MKLYIEGVWELIVGFFVILYYKRRKMKREQTDERAKDGYRNETMKIRDYTVKSINKSVFAKRTTVLPN